MVKAELLIQGSITLRDAISQLDKGGRGVLFVVDEKKTLLGILTDGDVRRAILRNVNLTVPVSDVMNCKCTTWPSTRSIEDAVLFMKKMKRRHMPVIDQNGVIVDIVLLDEIAFQSYDNIVVIMAGGVGSRLGELTRDCPKPLLSVGGKPVLETIIDNFKESGFTNFFFSVNYKSEMIEKYFQDGSKWDVSIRYLREKEKLGTAGALSLLPQKPDKPIIVMNGDLLTKINFQQLLNYHTQHKAIGTMCVREYSFQVPYGVVSIENGKLGSIEEKPVQSFFVSAGIYLLEPKALEYIPHERYFDMPSLFSAIAQNGFHANVYPIREYWIDIGKRDDYERANSEYLQVFG